MIEEYYRPTKIDDALKLLEKDPTSTFPLGGGNSISRRDSGKIKVVDLQALQLNKISTNSAKIAMGACVTLQQLIEDGVIPPALKNAAEKEGAINNRRTATLAGTLVSSGGQSPVGAVLRAMNATVVTQPGELAARFEDWMLTVKEGIPARLIVRIEIPAAGKSAYADIRKTPADRPIIYSSMYLSPEESFTWATGFKKGKELLVVNGRTASEILKNAHSHYTNSIIQNSYTQNMIEILHQRLLLSFSDNRMEK